MTEKRLSQALSIHKQPLFKKLLGRSFLFICCMKPVTMKFLWGHLYGSDLKKYMFWKISLTVSLKDDIIDMYLAFIYENLIISNLFKIFTLNLTRHF